MGDPAPQYTPRGFRIYCDFTDTYGKKVDVVESSLATGERVWIHAEDGAAHLDLDQAEFVRDALDEWIHDKYAQQVSDATD